METNDGFIVAVPAEIIDTDPEDDPTGYGQVRQAVARSIGSDLATVFAGIAHARGPTHQSTRRDTVTGQP